MKAHKQLILSIMRKRASIAPYELHHILLASGCLLSESTLTRKLRRYPEVYSIPPKNFSKSRVWKYALEKK